MFTDIFSEVDLFFFKRPHSKIHRATYKGKFNGLANAQWVGLKKNSRISRSLVA